MNSGDFGNAEPGLLDCHAQIIDLKNLEVNLIAIEIDINNKRETIMT